MRYSMALPLIASSLCTWLPAVQAQEFPVKPIRMLIGFPPGGGVDIVARQLAPRLSEQFGQQLVIDNRAGASGNIALELTAKSPPDGYTLMFTTPTITINPALYPRVPFDALRDFAPVALVATTVYVLVVHPSVPAKSVQALIALAKARPREILYSSGGNGAAAHLAGELFRSMAGIQITHVPYRGVAPALIATLAGEAHITFASQPAVLPHVKQGRLNALAVTSLRRSAFTPDLPGIAEAALPGYDTTAWYGIIAPAKTSAAIVGRLNREVQRALDHPETKAALSSQSFEAAGGTSEQFAALIRDELAKWSKVVKASGMRVD
jgi:tripartite-type tricarboxylate transporter receptor subunit TctC